MLVGCTAKLSDNNNEPLIPYFDKIVHFGIFGILGLIITLQKKSAEYKTLIICALYGIIIEIIQYFLPWRSFEIMDMIFDTLGAGAGILSANYLIKKIISK